jgi:hypothetical protein
MTPFDVEGADVTEFELSWRSDDRRLLDFVDNDEAIRAIEFEVDAAVGALDLLTTVFVLVVVFGAGFGTILSGTGMARGGLF